MVLGCPDSLNCYDWMGWSHWGLSCLLFSLRDVFYNVQVCVLNVMCGHVGAVAPRSGTVTTSFVGRKLCFLSDFVSFGVLLILPKF